MPYLLAADAVLLLHVLFVAFVIVGLCQHDLLPRHHLATMVVLDRSCHQQ